MVKVFDGLNTFDHKTCVEKNFQCQQFVFVLTVNTILSSKNLFKKYLWMKNNNSLIQIFHNTKPNKLLFITTFVFSCFYSFCSFFFLDFFSLLMMIMLTAVVTLKWNWIVFQVVTGRKTLWVPTDFHVTDIKFIENGKVINLFVNESIW